MKKIKCFIIFCLFLMCGCNPSTNKELSSNAEAKYNGIHNAMQTIPMIEVNDHIYVYPIVEGRKKSYYFPLEIKEDGFYSLLQKKYSTCSYDNVDACTSLMNAYNVNMNIYNDQLYFYEKRIEVEKRLNFLLNIDIKKSSLDLNNRHNEYTIKSFGEPIFYEINYTYPNIQFHKDKVYACYNNELYIGNINDSELTQFDLVDQKNILKVFFDQDTMFLYARKYIEGSSNYNYVVLQCDLNGNVQNVLLNNKNVLFVDKDFIFYTEKNKQKDTELYVYDINEHTHKKILEGAYQHVFKHNDLYLADTMGYNLYVNRLTLLNDEADIIHDKIYDENRHVSSLFMGDIYYVYDYNEQWFGYYKIEENGISDFHLCSKDIKEESN